MIAMWTTAIIIGGMGCIGIGILLKELIDDRRRDRFMRRMDGSLVREHEKISQALKDVFDEGRSQPRRRASKKEPTLN